ncbi:MAG: replication initiator protein [Microviridae sp.]|nr:MAG: replication initiator protein [Microviridae sp.]
MCGEYGSDFMRPHYHAIIFNCSFPDRVVHATSGSGMLVYRSAVLESLWTFGFSSVADFSFDAAAYVARYTMKKVTGKAQDEFYSVVDTRTGEIVNRVPEFNRMSLKPGIGKLWLDRYMSDVFPHDRVVVNGRECNPPKFYDRVFSQIDPVSFEAIQFSRESKARRYLHFKDSDQTLERLGVRQQVAEARASFFKRNFKE